jgi:leucyl-tRNA synthetase
MPISAALSATRNYAHNVASNVTSTEAAQLKKKGKGKGTTYDPKKSKRLSIYVALSYPSWQEKYIDLVREMFDKFTLSVNDKELNGKVAKMGEMKKAMPFVQGLKRRLTSESPDAVFNRQLAFDEVATLKEIVPGLKRTTGSKDVVIVVVEEGGKTGKTADGETVEGLPPLAEGAEPGNPRFEFTNIE